MKIIRQMPTIDELKRKYSLTEKEENNRIKRIQEIKNILTGISPKKLLLVGPCSADRMDAVLEYMAKLECLQKSVEDVFLFIPRLYTSKPRTTGCGYKGMLHHQEAADDNENLAQGVEFVRNLHLKVIRNTGFFCVDELLYPELFAYYSDLLAYAAIGARSVEDQGHRIAASYLDIPVGLKNPMNGDLEVLLNSIEAAQRPQTSVLHGMEVKSNGNKYAHAILRGYVENSKHVANYHYENICNLYDIYTKRMLSNLAVIVDCSHSNSGKIATQQIRIVKEIIRNMSIDNLLLDFIKGFMIESYLVDGNQLPGGNIYGRSITDSCIGWSSTEKLIMDIYAMFKEIY